MALSEDDRREVREEIWKGFTLFFQEHGVNPSDFAADHHFVTTWRDSTKTVRRASWWTITTLFITGLAGLIWAALSEKF